MDEEKPITWQKLCSRCLERSTNRQYPEDGDRCAHGDNEIGLAMEHLCPIWLSMPSKFYAKKG